MDASEIVIGYSEVITSHRKVWKKHYFDRPGALLALENTGSIGYGGREIPLTPGDLVLYDALPRHVFAGDGDWQYCWFHMPAEMFSEYAATPYNTVIPGVRMSHFEKAPLCRIRDELGEVHKLYRDRPENWKKLAELLLRVVLLRAFGSIGQGDDGDHSALTATLPQLRVFDSRLNLDTLARSCNMSRSVFFSRFRNHYGCSPIEYRNNVVINKAKQLLGDSAELSVKEIAGLLNFRDAYYFSKFFTARTGITPSAYRHGVKKIEKRG